MHLAIFFAAMSMVTHFVMGCLVLVRSPRNPAHRTFSGMLFLFFVWSFAELMLLTSPETPVFRSVLLTPIVTLPYLFARFAALFPRRQPDALILSEGYRGLLLFLPVVLLVCLAWGDQLFLAIDPYPLGLRFHFSRWEYPAKLILAGYLLLALQALKRARQMASADIQEKRIQYTFAGLTLPAAGGALFLLFGRWYFNQPGFTLYLYGLFPTLGVFMAALLGYAMLRYRLLEIDLIFSIGLVYTLMTAVLAGVLEILENLLQGFFEVTGIWATVFSTLVLAAAFNPLKNLVGMLVDYLFGRQSFDSAAVIRHLLREMRKAETPETVLGSLLRESAPVLGFSRSAILLHNGVRVVWPSDSPDIDASVLTISPAMTEKTEEIDALVEIALESSPPEAPSLLALQKWGVALMYPIMREQSFLGLWLIGVKTSRLPFSEQERSLINSIVTEIGPTLDNLRLVASLVERDRAARDVEVTLSMYRQIQAANGRQTIGSRQLFLYSSLAETIKGDLIDIESGADLPFLSLCDAFHQGIPAALTLYIIRTTLRAAQPERRLSILHRLLSASAEPPLRAAITLIEFHQADLQLTCAGNPPPLLLVREQPPRALLAAGSPLGLTAEPHMESVRLSLAPGEILCLSTNGLWKAFGDDTGEGLRSFLAAHNTGSAEELYQRLTEHLTIAHSSVTILDDISFVLIQEQPTS